MKYFFIAGEASGDLHGSSLIDELKKLDDAFEIRYFGGDMMRAASGADTTKAYIDSSYVTFDMAASYKATKDLTIFAKGYNLTNKAYAESAGTYLGAYCYPAQSRRFIVGAEYSF